jgi:hypothetical protein
VPRYYGNTLILCSSVDVGSKLRGFPSAFKRLGREARKSPPSSTEVKFLSLVGISGVHRNFVLGGEG